MSSNDKDFTNLVDNCSSKKLDTIIHNASKDHALYLFKKLMQSATPCEEIRILSGHLNAEFYGGLVEDLRECINKNCTVSIIVLNATIDIAKNQFAKLANESGKLIIAPEGYGINIDKHPHFIVVGKRAFRLETDHSQAKAIASFNEPEVAGTLISIFDRLKENLNVNIPVTK